MTKNTNSVRLCQQNVFCRIVGMSKMRFLKRRLHFWSLSFYVGERETEKERTKWKNTENPIENSVLRWSFQNVKIQKHGFLAKIAWHYLCQEGWKTAHFRAHYLLWPKNLWGPKQCKAGNTIKDRGFSGYCPKPKMTLLFEKGVFWHGRKSGFTSCFLKSCAFLKTLFYSVSRKHISCIKKAVCRKKTENLWK